MTDQPIPAKILLSLRNCEISGEDFISLSGTLYRQNLIFSEPRELRRNDNILEMVVIFRDYYSFNNWENNAEIQEFWINIFDKLLEEPPKTIREKDVIIETDNIKNCVCTKSNFYILQGRTFRFVDELTCSNCLGQIPYSRIPLEISIEDWQTKHERVYSNWLESGLFEKEAYKELINYKKGKLNIEGERIRKQLSNYFQIPVYISYFLEDPHTHHNCLICGQPGVDSGLNSPNKICRTCNTIFGYDA